MRKEFSQWLEQQIKENSKMVFITGDLGFQAFEGVAKAAGKRFVNAGVSEQNMITLAAGLASQGFLPLCYSIAPFAVFRPLEQIRLDVCIHRLNVKIIGNGGGYGYGIMGATHHALEDLAALTSLPNMRAFIPLWNEDLFFCADSMLAYRGPSYLRLGAGPAPVLTPQSSPDPFRKILSGSQAVAVGLGPITQNILKAELEFRANSNVQRASVYGISELPILELSHEFIEEVRKTGRLLIAEEHVERGGLAEHLSLLMLKYGIHAKMINLCARGYPNDLYGSQAYHQKISKLDSASIHSALSELVS